MLSSVSSRRHLVLTAVPALSLAAACACGVPAERGGPPGTGTRRAATGATGDARPAADEPAPIGFASLGAGTTGGRGGETVTISTAADLLRYLRLGEPVVIQVAGTIALPRGMHNVASHKSLVGAGAGARITQGGFNLSGVNNVIIRNLTFEGAADDAINLQDRTERVWIDHCTFEKAYDGLVDVKRESSFVTVSWNVFRFHNKTSLVGHDDNYRADIGRLKVTYHHNWFLSDSRLPRVRFGEVHVFNNFYDSVKSYAIASTQEAAVVVEGNYFRNVRRPTLIGLEESGPGDLVKRHNIFDNSGTPETRGTAFDPAAYYAYMLDDPASVPDKVRQGAGAGKW